MACNMMHNMKMEQEIIRRNASGSMAYRRIKMRSVHVVKRVIWKTFYSNIEMRS